jgi:hypothetical protein
MFGGREVPHSTLLSLANFRGGPTQMHSTWHPLLQNIELMPQYQDFGFQPLPRLEAVTQHADEQHTDCNHSAIMF